MYKPTNKELYSVYVSRLPILNVWAKDKAHAIKIVKRYYRLFFKQNNIMILDIRTN